MVEEMHSNGTENNTYETLTLYDYADRPETFDLQDKAIVQIDVSVITGDEEATVTYADGDQDTFSAYPENRTEDFFDGCYTVKGGMIDAFMNYEPDEPYGTASYDRMEEMISREDIDPDNVELSATESMIHILNNILDDASDENDENKEQNAKEGMLRNVDDASSENNIEDEGNDIDASDEEDDGDNWDDWGDSVD